MTTPTTSHTTSPTSPIMSQSQSQPPASTATTTTTTTTTTTITRQILQRLPIPQLPGYESRLVLLTYPPGINAPPHTHPVSSTGYIVEGACLSQWEGGEEELYVAGESFVDHGVRLHVRSENVSPRGGSLRMLLSYVIKVGDANVEIK